MPVAVDVPVAVGVAVWIAQEAEVRTQPAGTASFRSRVEVGAYEICAWEPLPAIVQEASPDADGAEALNGNDVPSSGFATFTIVRKPLLGAKTQSEGSEFGSPRGSCRR